MTNRWSRLFPAAFGLLFIAFAVLEIAGGKAYGWAGQRIEQYKQSVSQLGDRRARDSFEFSKSENELTPEESIIAPL